MFEDYFMQMLTATALQMAHPFSTISAYSFQYFLRYLTNKCFNVVFQCVNWSALVCIAPQKIVWPVPNVKYNVHRTRLSISPLLSVLFGMWHHVVETTCHSSKTLAFWAKKSWISAHGSAHRSQLRYDSQHL